MGWLEVVLVNVAREMAWNIQMVFDEGAIDYQLRLIIGNLARPVLRKNVIPGRLRKSMKDFAGCATLRLCSVSLFFLI